MEFYNFAEKVSHWLEWIALIVIVIGFLVALVRFFAKVVADRASATLKSLRRDFGQAMLLALEFLIAADIVKTLLGVGPDSEGMLRTLNGALSYETVKSLGILVVIRIVLSVSITWEVEGRLPWKGKTAATDA